nr:natural killer cell receptor 2B4 isoform X3 [Misgurnus anguillicaudatus]
MNTIQGFCCSIFGVLFFLLQGLCAETEVVHRAVGSSLELIPDHPKTNLTDVKWTFNETVFAEYTKNELKLLRDNLFAGWLEKGDISITVNNLQLQDSGLFSIVQEGHSGQYETKFIQLHVHDLIRNVTIEHNEIWLQSKNICTFNLWCLVSDNVNTSYHWSGYPNNKGSHLNISLTPEVSATLNCTVSNIVSVNYTTKTVKCSETLGQGFLKKNLLLISIVAGAVCIAVAIGIIAVCYRRRAQKGKGESEAGITVYEDVNVDPVAKKRSDSTINGTSIYETVQDVRVTSNMPQTVYDKISYQRQQVVTPSTSSPYQKVLKNRPSPHSSRLLCGSTFKSPNPRDCHIRFGAAQRISSASGSAINSTVKQWILNGPMSDPRTRLY